MSEPESKIVEAVAISANASPFNPNGKVLARAIELAMSAAVLRCSDAGITDPDEIRASMLTAREQIKAAFYQAVLNPQGANDGDHQ